MFGDDSKVLHSSSIYACKISVFYFKYVNNCFFPKYLVNKISFFHICFIQELYEESIPLLPNYSIQASKD